MSKRTGTLLITGIALLCVLVLLVCDATGVLPHKPRYGRPPLLGKYDRLVSIPLGLYVAIGLTKKFRAALKGSGDDWTT